MKKIILTISLLSCVQFLFSQNSTKFECGGYEFTVWDNSTPIRYSVRPGDKITRDFSGRVSKIGKIRISYDFSGKVNRIGNVRISRDFSGKINRIGNMRFNYDLSGRFTGSSGNIGCNW